MAGDRRLLEWIDLVGDLLQRPLADFPVALIAMQLNRTFQVRAVSWDWREDEARSGFQTWPRMDLGAIAHLPPWDDETQGILDQHPLIRWFVTTRDPTPQSTGRVPDSLAKRTDEQLVNDYLKPLGFDQQLSIPYAFDGFRYGAFVLGRPDNDFLDDDLELAGHLQRLIRGLYLQTAPMARSPMRAKETCAAAERTRLTATEFAVLILLAEGHTACGIAHRLGMAPRTASKHLEHIYRKFGVADRLAAVLAAQEAGIVAGARGGRSPSAVPDSPAANR